MGCPMRNDMSSLCELFGFRYRFKPGAPVTSEKPLVPGLSQ